jgi:hypothetical protein
MGYSWRAWTYSSSNQPYFDNVWSCPPCIWYSYCTFGPISASNLSSQRQNRSDNCYI